MRMILKRIAAFGFWSLAVATVTNAQDMTRYLDLASPEMTTAEMTRDDVARAVEYATRTGPPALSAGVFSRFVSPALRPPRATRAAPRLNKSKLIGAKLDGAILDQAWLLDADLNGASLKGASVFAAQMQRAN